MPASRSARWWFTDPVAGEKEGSVWPLPKFYFSVNFGAGTDAPFQEVSGLDTEAQPIEYRSGNRKAFSTIKMPGLIKTGNVILKKGIFVNDTQFWDWFNKVKMNTIKRETVVISLLDQEAKPTMVWTLHNAWPTKIQGTDMKSDGNEVAVELVELAHEKLTVAQP